MVVTTRGVLLVLLAAWAIGIVPFYLYLKQAATRDGRSWNSFQRGGVALATLLWPWVGLLLLCIVVLSLTGAPVEDEITRSGWRDRK